jgi:hypothetical protein
MKVKRAARLLIVIVLVGLGRHDALTTECAGADDLCGWYKVSTGNRLIPVFKIDGTYYTIGILGFEVALTECPDGLEWPRTPPTSMVGTKIGFDAESNEIYLGIVDRIREVADGFVSGQKQPMTAIDKPLWLRDATAQPPRRLDDFLGWYEPVWWPYARGQIRKESGKYLVVVQLLQRAGEKGSWVPHDEQHELTPLADELGFTMHVEQEDGHRLRIRMVYSETRRRFELQLTSPAMESHVARMPLAPTPPPPPKEGAVPLPPTDIGIPSWN